MLSRLQGDKDSFEVLFAGLRAQLIRRTGGKHPCVIHRDQPIANARLIHIGGGDDDTHRRSLAPEVSDEIPELSSRQRIDPGRRLVENEKVGIVNERAAQTELLLHAARQLSGRPIEKGEQTGRGRQTARARVTLRRGQTEEGSEEAQVLADADLLIEVLAESLRHIGNARADGTAMPRIAHAAAEDRDRSGLQLSRSGDEAEKCGLSGTIGTDDARHPAARQFERDIVERPDLAVAVRSAGNLGDQWCGSHHRQSPASRGSP